MPSWAKLLDLVYRFESGINLLGLVLCVLKHTRLHCPHERDVCECMCECLCVCLFVRLTVYKCVSDGCRCKMMSFLIQWPKNCYKEARLPVACGRVGDLLEREQGISSSSSVFTDHKHPVLTLNIDIKVTQQPFWHDAVFAGLHCLSVFVRYLVICFCQGLHWRQIQLLLEGTGRLILMTLSYWPITTLQWYVN